MQRLTDRAALLAHRARAARQGSAFFLHDEARIEIEERLKEVNRTFTAPALVTGQATPWEGMLPGARLVEDAEVLALEPGAHDLVIHALALHWADDPVGQIIQARRALRPDGLFLAVAFGGRTLHELRSALAEAEVEITGGLSPRVAPMAEIRDMGALLQRAGLALPVADSVPLRVSYPDLAALMHDLRAMGETNALASRGRPLSRSVLAKAEEIYRAHFAQDGRLLATFELVFLTGWSPHESQQAPLRPGSAKARLADALGVPELRSGDAAGPLKD
jgi:SAM-dependent methyltransferase